MKIERIKFQETHNQVKYIQNTFDECEIRIKEHSFLFKLLSNTLKNYDSSNTPYEIFDALHVKRIYSALVTLEGFGGKNKYLKDLMRSTLDFMDASESHSKNILFELEVTGSLRKIFKDTYLDEPDIVVPFNDGNVGIACKKSFQKRILKSNYQMVFNKSKITISFLV